MTFTSPCRPRQSEFSPISRPPGILHPGPLRRREFPSSSASHARQPHPVTRGPTSPAFHRDIINMLFHGLCPLRPTLGATTMWSSANKTPSPCSAPPSSGPPGIQIANLLNTVGYFSTFSSPSPPWPAPILPPRPSNSELFAVFLCSRHRFSCGIAGVYASARYRHTFIAIAWDTSSLRRPLRR
jgi:hypothetical protein